MSRLSNFVLFYVGWFACVAGAAHGQLWLGPFVVSVLLFVHLALARDRREEITLILAAGVLGFASDSAQASAGLYAFTNTSAMPWLCPPWMVALWMIFASTLNSSMAWLGDRFGLAAVLGAVFGPLSYLAGARLGAIELHTNTPLALAAIAAVWALVMPALLWLRATVHAARPAVVLAIALLLVVVPTPRPTAAAEIEGVQFAEQYQRDNVTMALHCVGLLRYKVLFKGYVAGLYLGDGVAPAEALGDVPKRIELSYFWSIDGSDFAKAGDEILARNVDADTMARLRPQLAQMNALYETVNPGDRYALTYVPGLGTELTLNGRSKGTIPGADFAAAYFRIWLGQQSIDTALRDQLLTCRNRG